MAAICLQARSFRWEKMATPAPPPSATPTRDQISNTQIQADPGTVPIDAREGESRELGHHEGHRCGLNKAPRKAVRARTGTYPSMQRQAVPRPIQNHACAARSDGKKRKQWPPLEATPSWRSTRTGSRARAFEWRERERTGHGRLSMLDAHRGDASSGGDALLATETTQSVCPCHPA